MFELIPPNAPMFSCDNARFSETEIATNISGLRPDTRQFGFVLGNHSFWCRDKFFSQKAHEILERSTKTQHSRLVLEGYFAPIGKGKVWKICLAKIAVFDFDGDAFCDLKTDYWYEQYLLSKQWQEVRSRVIERDKGKCAECGTSYSLIVHHLTYDHVGEEPLEDLITLCYRCH